MKKFRKYILLIIILPDIIFASGGSIYSRFGLGDFYYSYSARRMGMGELGIASIDYDYLNFLNPASWSKLRLTRVETGIIYHGNNISSNSNSVFYSQTIFTGFLIGFPIDHQYGVSLTAGLLPFSNVDYDVTTEENNDLTGSYKLTYSGKGGLSKAFIGLSYKLPFDFALGASFDYYLGKITHKSSIEFNSSSTYRDGSFSDEYSYSGIGFTVGLISSNLAQLIKLNDTKDLRIGITFSSKSTIDADTVNNSTTIIGTLSNSSGKITTKLPYRFGAGLSLQLSDYLIVADYLYQPFNQLTKDNKHINELKNLQKLSLGVEYRKSELRSHSYWEQVKLRGGLSYEKTQYHINNKSIDMIAVYTGFSLPLGLESTIDIAFQFGKRGTTANNLLKENIYKFSITLSLGEIWFIRQER
ncbi:MAG: hypothetical protein QHH13_00060 [Melioribacter sp.]|uniref:OmpP1/FadL family transporter n=1 Tax=Rosettibacter primus TaxID=3111523 RepID=UPI00247CC2AE|nr:hypothetical protein [Melioribacter sp.]